MQGVVTHISLFVLRLAVPLIRRFIKAFSKQTPDEPRRKHTGLGGHDDFDIMMYRQFDVPSFGAHLEDIVEQIDPADKETAADCLKVAMELLVRELKLTPGIKESWATTVVNDERSDYTVVTSKLFLVCALPMPVYYAMAAGLLSDGFTYVTESNSYNMQTRIADGGAENVRSMGD